MDIEIPKLVAESSASKPARTVGIAVELPAISLKRKREFVLVEDLDDAYDGNEVSILCYVYPIWRLGQGRWAHERRGCRGLCALR